MSRKCLGSVWGHEHRCEIGSGAGTEAVGNNFVVLQPGSTVATSLVEGEAEDKHVGLLEVIRRDSPRFAEIRRDQPRTSTSGCSRRLTSARLL